jgi:hypothetical protein
MTATKLAPMLLLLISSQPETREKTLSNQLQAAEAHIEKKQWAEATALLQMFLDRARPQGYRPCLHRRQMTSFSGGSQNRLRLPA